MKRQCDLDSYGVNIEKYQLVAIYPANRFSKSMYETFNINGWLTKNVFNENGTLVMVRVYERRKRDISFSEIPNKGCWEK